MKRAAPASVRPYCGGAGAAGGPPEDPVVCENSAGVATEAGGALRSARDVHPATGSPSRFPASLEVPALRAKAGDPWTRCLPRSPFFLLLFSGWVNRQQQAVIDYLLEENRILRAERGRRRLRLTDDQRRRLAVKGKALDPRRLGDIAGIVTPDTILRWYRRLVAKRYAGSKKRVPGRPSTKLDIVALVVRLANENPTRGLHANPGRAEEPRPRSRS